MAATRLDARIAAGGCCGSRDDIHIGEGPSDGVLRDPEAEGGEQQAAADLFAGAIGAYKNPDSHRTVKFEDPVEAAEAIQLADLLLRIVRRARDRTAYPSMPASRNIATTWR